MDLSDAKRLLLALLMAAVLAPSPADARRYSVPIDVSDSDDLRQLYYEGVIDEDEFDILMRLIENPIDLNQAEKFDVFQLPDVDATLSDRIVEERILNGPYTLLADLVNRVPGVDWRLVDKIRPFVYLRLPEGTTPALRGEIGFTVFKQFRAVDEAGKGYVLVDQNGQLVAEPTEDSPGKSRSAAELGYDKWPAFGLAAHTDIQGWLDIGLSGTAQEGLWNATYDPHSQDVHGSYGTPVFRPYVGYARIRRPVGSSRLQVVAGSYHLNFGEGLVMNTLGGRKRTGFVVPGRVAIERGDRRFREWDGLFGGAGSLRAPLSGGAELDLTVFGSLRNYDQFVNYVKAAGGVAYDPLNDNGLSAPRVWVDGRRIASQTLPNLFRVGVVGGNATFRINRRTHLGVTGYAGLIDRTVMKGVENQNDILLKRRWPVKQNFGSFGVNGRIGFGLLEVSGEYALSIGDDVGQGMIVFVEVEPAWGRFVFSARHYDIKFASSYARAQSSTVPVGGLRTRGQQGLRFRAVIEPIKRLGARVTFDLNRHLIYDVWDITTWGSIQGRPLEWLQLQVQTRYVNQNLAVNGREHEYGGDISEFADFGYVPDDPDQFEEGGLERAGESISARFGVRADHKKLGSINVRYSRSWVDAGKTHPLRNSDSCRVDWLQGHGLRVWGRLKPGKTTTVGASFLVADTDVAGNKSGGSVPSGIGKHGFEAYLSLRQKVADRVTLSLRGTLGKRIPNAPSQCDFGEDLTQVGPPEYEYEPSAYELRWFGDAIFQMRVKFY